VIVVIGVPHWHVCRLRPKIVGLSESCLAFVSALGKPLIENLCYLCNTRFVSAVSPIRCFARSLPVYGKYRMTSPDYSANRRAMIDSQLRTSGVSQPWVVAAMGAAPRENFVPAAMRSVAYMDRSIALDNNGRKLNPPVAAAMILEAAEVTRSDNVLLIGAGTGYLAALLATRAASVVAVEEDAALLSAATQTLSGAANVSLVNGALNAGAAETGPYSLIIIDGAVNALTTTLTDQLTDGGRVVCGYLQNVVTRLAIGYRRGEPDGHAIALRVLADTEIASLPGFAKIAEFVF
jgi:protein-L-isoaspartate(D-aspartate) O-methyltransferase